MGNFSYLLAEGLINGKVVASFKREPSRRPAKIRLRVDDSGYPLQADGSDVVVVVAELVDANGVVKRLSNGSIRFTVAGAGQLLANEATDTNPAQLNWGSAPVLIQSTDQAGTIKVTAEFSKPGVHAIETGEITFASQPVNNVMIYDAALLKASYKQTESKASSANQSVNADAVSLQKEVERLQKKISEYELREVERDQDDFGEQR